MRKAREGLEFLAKACRVLLVYKQLFFAKPFLCVGDLAFSCHSSTTNSTMFHVCASLILIRERLHANAGRDENARKGTCFAFFFFLFFFLELEFWCGNRHVAVEDFH